MLIFVILSITNAYLVSKLSESQSQQLSHLCYHYHSRATIFCRTLSPSMLLFCPSILLPYPPPYHPSSSSLSLPLCPLRLRLLLSRICRRLCPIICPFSPPCPLPISCPISCPLRPFPTLGPPSVTPPQYYDNTRLISSTFSMPTHYLNGIPESFNYKDKLTDNAYLAGDTEIIEKTTTSTTYHTYPTVILNIKHSKSTESIPSSDQQFIYSTKYLPHIIHNNASTPSSYIGNNEFVERNIRKNSIRNNYLSNNNNFIINDIIMPPQNDCCTKCSTPCYFRYGQEKISLNTNHLQEMDPICNNESMKQIIVEHANDDINKSIIRIQQVARRLLGGLFGVICGNDNFAYIIQTKDFCQHRTGNITCYIFRSLLDYNFDHY